MSEEKTRCIAAVVNADEKGKVITKDSAEVLIESREKNQEKENDSIDI